MLTSRKLCTFLCIALGIFSSIIAYGTEYGDASPGPSRSCRVISWKAARVCSH